MNFISALAFSGHHQNKKWYKNDDTRYFGVYTIISRKNCQPVWLCECFLCVWKCGCVSLEALLSPSISSRVFPSEFTKKNERDSLIKEKQRLFGARWHAVYREKKRNVDLQVCSSVGQIDARHIVRWHQFWESLRRTVRAILAVSAGNPKFMRQGNS